MGENIYFFMIIALAVLAVTDLIVGVSNDAVNFLNSAIGSKAISFKTIMIVASIGIAFGAVSSSGMMEVARKGIFNPSEFVFAEIMIIFMAVMITDIILLDFFNTLGMPTSTTVSIVFELLGAAVAISLVKIYAGDGNFTHLTNYINTDKATEIIVGILLSVVIAFTIGAFVQFFTRVLLSFKFENKPKWVGAIFGGMAITAIIYFILIKGLKGTSILSPETSMFIGDNPEIFILGNFLLWFALSWVVTRFLSWNIYVIIIILGTFALAMAFAGNDLVNFIGVPLAAYESFVSWSNSGQLASEFNMQGLSVSVQTPTYLLLASGVVMVVTLWFSSKAKNVVKTSVDLSRQDEGDERFEPNFLSRQIVKFSIKASDNLNGLIPAGLQKRINGQFEKPTSYAQKAKVKDLPAFDLIRASVNLMVASVLISLATSLKLPLSTTYVTFMVAMGSSLADRAWGSESAVYRVAGVLNVIGGWFFTAIVAFVAASLIAYIIHLGGIYAIAALLVFAFILIGKNYISHTRKLKESKEEEKLERAESSSVQGVIEESAKNIANVVKRTSKIYSNTINGLAKQDLNLLKKNKKQGSKLATEIEDLRNHTFYFIKNLEEAHIGASNFYINAMGHLTDISQSLEYIGKVSHKHVNNNHKKLKYNQIKELKQIDYKLAEILENTSNAFEERSFEKIGTILNNKQELYDLVSQKIKLQVERTRTEESSPKNTTLYFSILLETKDLMTATMNLLEQYYKEYDEKIEPARLD
ncbi:Phosphate transporter family protein [Maribacter orientalis]|uniref:Phosphate transporter n=1 Tax=Maribacter orientalis TaxID=228957 RepID=A0A1H7S0A5_9FLAO|nr:inorganic phosphate transporter [Maribacter orientalis]SEL65922.1 Phosphate transporter family protein [Maribacter orientalis]|tara:strand:- start:512 stop:2779 length:2268 start_codon:yes stop_codon:yes gene_type:complete